MNADSCRVFSSDQLIAARVKVAETFWQRFRGLLNHPPLSRQQGLLLSPGASVHTFGMSYPIDVIFLSNQQYVLAVRTHLVPNRACFSPPGTASTLELCAGVCREVGLHRGSRLEFREQCHD